jgi:hypothetical protein
MNAVPFDTLKFACKLEASGTAGAMAAGTAEALADAMSGVELATKTDIGGVRTELKADIAGVRTELTALRTELKTDIASLRTELTGMRTEVKSDLELLRRDLVIKVGSMLVISVGVLLTAIRYLPPHP